MKRGVLLDHFIPSILLLIVEILSSYSKTLQSLNDRTTPRSQRLRSLIFFYTHVVTRDRKDFNHYLQSREKYLEGEI